MSDVKGYVWMLVLLVHFIKIIDSHPQCLDFRAPFRPGKNLTFCSEYSKLGCCGSSKRNNFRNGTPDRLQDDKKLQKEFEFIRSRADENAWNRCQGYIKDILCQKCSPYAAHIYDAEGTHKAREFPGLCRSYCYDFHDQCSDFVWFLDRGNTVTSALKEKDRFCKEVAITDVLYCYPDLLTRPLLLRNLTSFHNPTATPGCLCLETIRDNLANPLWARHAGDGSGRMFVAEQKGRVRIYNTRTKRWNKNCFLDFTRKTEVSKFVGDERGFLGMAFHPRYASNGRFFVYYSTSRKPGDVLPRELSDRAFPFKSKIVISEVRVSDSDPNMADPSYERVLIEVFQPYENHNGGELMFGLDGYLYAFIGDGGGAGDPMEAGQNKSMLHGKVIRVDVDADTTKPYTIPLDNPFVAEPGTRPEIFAYGIRNIWRCGLDKGGKSRGRILCGDVGQNAFEELDIIRKGANYGWNSREGFECYDDLLCGRIGREDLPIHAYDHSIGQSVTGGVFYRGCENPALLGQYIYGDFTSSRLFSLTESDGVWTNNDVHLCGPSLCQGGLVGSSSEYILSFGEDEDGEIYMLTSKSGSSATCNGKVYKIVDPIRRNDPSSCTSDLSRKTRVPLSRRDKLLTIDKVKSNAALSTITIRIRMRKGEANSTSAVYSSDTKTFETHHNKELSFAQLQQENQENQRTRLSQSPMTSLLPNSTRDYSQTSPDFLITAAGDRIVDSPSAQRQTSRANASLQGSSGPEQMTQDPYEYNLTTKTPGKKRKSGKENSKRRRNKHKLSKSRKHKCNVC